METAQVPHEDYLCYCEWLTREDVITAIPLARDVRDLMNRTGINTLCYGCADDLDDVVAQYGHLFASSNSATPASVSA